MLPEKVTPPISIGAGSDCAVAGTQLARRKSVPLKIFFKGMLTLLLEMVRQSLNFSATISSWTQLAPARRAAGHTGAPTKLFAPNLRVFQNKSSITVGGF